MYGWEFSLEDIRYASSTRETIAKQQLTATKFCFPYIFPLPLTIREKILL